MFSQFLEELGTQDAADLTIFVSSPQVSRIRKKYSLRKTYSLKSFFSLAHSFRNASRRW